MRPSRGGPSGSPARLALAFLATGFVLSSSLLSCGLETVKVFAAPAIVNNNGFLTLTHNAANDSDSSFLGYEIYYRAYQDSTAAEADRSALMTVINAVNATPEACIFKLESLKYHRFYNYLGIDGRPLFKSFSTYDIYLSSSLGWYIDQYRTPTDTSKIYRAISTSDSLYGFNPSYSTNDADYSGSTTSTGPIYFVFFAIAYGFDFTSNIKEVYSLPAGLDSAVTYSY